MVELLTKCRHCSNTELRAHGAKFLCGHFEIDFAGKCRLEESAAFIMGLPVVRSDIAKEFCFGLLATILIRVCPQNRNSLPLPQTFR